MNVHSAHNNRSGIRRAAAAALLLLVMFETALAGGTRVVAYYPSWVRGSLPHTAIQYGSVTHLAHAFIFPYANGTLDLSGFSLYPELIQTAHQNGVKVVISVGGWDNVRTPRFSQMAADTAARHRFVAQMAAFCVQYGYDGVDLDWEYPTSSDKQNATLLYLELSAALSALSPARTLSMAAPASASNFDWAVIAPALDWIGVMTYDYYGSWTTKAGPNSPLYGNWATNDQGWIDYSMNYYAVTKGIPRSKLLMGIPFYGWRFNASALYGTSTGAAQLPLNQIIPLLSEGWTQHWDDTGKIPYCISPDGTKIITYDDDQSVALKCQYLHAQNLGGTIIWCLGQDNYGGVQYLLDVVARELLTTGIESQQTLRPLTPCLMRNYPNPFNGQTTIEYSLPRAGIVSLKVYTLLGREVRTLEEGHRSAGTHRVRADFDDLASGVYLFRLVTPGGTIARSMMLLR